MGIPIGLILLVLVLATPFLISEILVQNLPRGLRQLQKSNCWRRDGTWSKRRAHIEAMGRARLRWQLMMTLGLIMVPNILVLVLINLQLVPLGDLAQQAARPHSGLHTIRTDARRTVDGWIERNNLPWDREAYVGVAKKIWPVVGIGLLIWLVAGFLMIKGVYFRLLKDFGDRAKERAEAYFYRDFGKLM